MRGATRARGRSHRASVGLCSCLCLCLSRQQSHRHAEPCTFVVFVVAHGACSSSSFLSPTPLSGPAVHPPHCRYLYRQGIRYLHKFETHPNDICETHSGLPEPSCVSTPHDAESAGDAGGRRRRGRTGARRDVLGRSLRRKRVHVGSRGQLPHPWCVLESPVAANMHSYLSVINESSLD